jgi:exodeoxyribonuclease VII large subunit
LQPEVIRAVAGHAAADVDVIVITRGGGSRADLSWFDQRDLAVAIAECSVPVITAIGHEVDTSIADLVAHHACKTPTAAAEFLVERVDAASGRLEDTADRLATVALDLLDQSRARIDLTARLIRGAEGVRLRARIRYQSTAGRLHDRLSRSLTDGRAVLAELRTKLGTTAVTGISRAREKVGGLRVGIAGAAGARTAGAKHHQEVLTDRLQREALRPLVTLGTRLENLATQVRLLDPGRLLARGFTITTDAGGRAVTSAAALDPGDIIDTHFSDGRVRSLVQPQTGTKRNQGKGKSSGGKKDEPQENTGQKTLFR